MLLPLQDFEIHPQQAERYGAFGALVADVQAKVYLMDPPAASSLDNDRYPRQCPISLMAEPLMKP